MEETVKMQSIKNVTHDVLQIVTEKPAGIDFVPGQATEISINKDGWEGQGRPFTFTSLPKDDHLEFIIKTYPSHESVTDELNRLEKGDELILHDVFGAINYKGEGTFIAGGAGVTPFISIFRDLQSKNEIGKNKLIFANKTEADIILKEEFQDMLGDNFINILSEEKKNGYANGIISTDFLRANSTDTTGYFYICGPMPMIEAVEKQLKEMGIDENSIVKEES